MTRRQQMHQAVSTLPLTNALGSLLIAMWSATCFFSLLNLPITDGWYTALTFYTGGVVAQFGVKRWTYDPQKAQAAAAISNAQSESGISP